MYSVKKGNDFENTVYDIINKLLLDNQLIVPPNFTKIFKKKNYFSRDRNDFITVDISLEVTHPNADTYSLLIIVECKDYNHPIPVDDIEEFVSKIDQIAGKNVKAIFVTTNSLQKSALEYAKSKGIAVLRILPDSQVQYILYQMSPIYSSNKAFLNENKQSLKALTIEDYIGDNQNTYGYVDGIFLSEINEIFNHYLMKFKIV